MEEFSRTKIVLGEKTKKIENSHIAILGLGGVGGYVLEMFARLNVKKLTIVDCDIIEKTNINRQLLATTQTLSMQKTQAAKERVATINPFCNVAIKNEKITCENVDKILNKKVDYVLDCIDDVSAKIAIIKFCHEKEIPLLTAVGTGNRYKNPAFAVENLFKTTNDPLAKKLRSELRKQGIEQEVLVCCTKDNVEKLPALGSVVYYPLLCAGTMVSFVTNQILSKS